MKRITAVLVASVLAACMTGCGNSVTIHGTNHAMDTTTLVLDSNPIDAMEALSQLKELEVLDLQRASLTPQEFDALRRALPGVTIVWNVPLDGTVHSSFSNHLSLSDFSQANLDMLVYFPQLTDLDASGCKDLSQLAALLEQFPQLNVQYQIPLGGTLYSPEETVITPVNVNLDELTQAIPLFTGLKEVNLDRSGFGSEDVQTLSALFPQLRFQKTVSIAGQAVNPDTEELEFNGPDIPLSDIEAAIPFLPELKKVVLLDSGLTDEELDTLNQKYPTVQIVWNMQIGAIPVRTDDNFFAPVVLGFYKIYSEEDYAKLNYMTEVECVDLGHNAIPSIDWVKNMPKLKYLVLADSPITDISALSGHPSLVYLEIFGTRVTDYSPLTTCMQLEDLNISRTRGDPTPLAQMTWLKNLWWGDNLAEIENSFQSWEYRKLAESMLPGALPNTNVKIYYGAPTMQGWRELPNYFAMRDCMGMYYMNGSTD